MPGLLQTRRHAHLAGRFLIAFPEGKVSYARQAFHQLTDLTFHFVLVCLQRSHQH